MCLNTVEYISIEEAAVSSPGVQQKPRKNGSENLILLPLVSVIFKKFFPFNIDLSRRLFEMTLGDNNCFPNNISLLSSVRKQSAYLRIPTAFLGKLINDIAAISVIQCILRRHERIPW